MPIPPSRALVPYDPATAAAQHFNIPERVSRAVIANLERDRFIAIEAPMKPAAGPLGLNGTGRYKPLGLDIRSNELGFDRHRGETFISDPDLMVAGERGRIYSDPFVRQQLVPELNRSWRGRDIAPTLAVERGGILLEPTDPFQHSHQATYFTVPEAKPGIAGALPKPGVVVYKLDPRTGQPVVFGVPADSYVDWLRGEAYAEDLSWYPWATQAQDWSSWYEFVGSGGEGR